MTDDARVSAVASWGRFLGVGAAYAATFAVVRRVWPFSLDSPGFVITGMICVLGLTSVARPVIRLRMPVTLRHVCQWETDGPIPRWLGVRRFGRLLRQTPLRLLNTHVYVRAGERDLSRVSQELEAAEASHALSALLVVPYLVRAAGMGWWGSLLWVATAQLVINLLPIMHLRLARAGVSRRLQPRS